MLFQWGYNLNYNHIPQNTNHCLLANAFTTMMHNTCNSLPNAWFTINAKPCFLKSQGPVACRTHLFPATQIDIAHINVNTKPSHPYLISLKYFFNRNVPWDIPLLSTWSFSPLAHNRIYNCIHNRSTYTQTTLHIEYVELRNFNRTICIRICFDVSSLPHFPK